MHDHKLYFSIRFITIKKKQLTISESIHTFYDKNVKQNYVFENARTIIFNSVTACSIARSLPRPEITFYTWKRYFAGHSSAQLLHLIMVHFLINLISNCFGMREKTVCYILLFFSFCHFDTGTSRINGGLQARKKCIIYLDSHYPLHMCVHRCGERWRNQRFSVRYQFHHPGSAKNYIFFWKEALLRTASSYKWRSKERCVGKS